jgi:hypothetical protein
MYRIEPHGACKILKSGNSVSPINNKIKKRPQFIRALFTILRIQALDFTDYSNKNKTESQEMPCLPR